MIRVGVGYKPDPRHGDVLHLNQGGIVYEKNLGPGTDAAGHTINACNPGASGARCLR